MSLQEFVVVDFIDGFEVVGFKTVAWDSVKDYQRACYIADHRPGTTVVQIVLGVDYGSNTIGLIGLRDLTVRNIVVFVLPSLCA